MCPKCFLKIAGKANHYQFYLPNFLKFCHNISHKLLRPTQFLKNLTPSTTQDRVQYRLKQKLMHKKVHVDELTRYAFNQTPPTTLFTSYMLL